ncbi:MAG TPA: hypothetical protein VGK03_03795 [Geothrix sp.]|jgi:hypothetical protein
MLTEAFTLALQLPPLAFNPGALPCAFQPPRELTCPVRELGRVWVPPAPRPLWSVQLSLDPRSLRHRGPEHLVNPLADILLLFALAGWASSTGGTVDFRAWPERNPALAAPLPPPFMSSGSWAKPGL